MATMREAFEKWFSDDGAYPNAVKRSNGGEYLLSQAATGWNVWQAAYSSRDEQVRILREALAKAERGLESASCYFDDEDSRGTVLSVERSLRSVRRALEATKV